MSDNPVKKGKEPAASAPKEETQQGELVLARHAYPVQLSIIPLDNRPVFPKMAIPMVIEDKHLREMILKLKKDEPKFVGLVLRKNIDEKQATGNVTLKGTDLHKVGCVAEILQVAQLAPDTAVHILVNVLERIVIDYFVEEEPIIVAHVNYQCETEMSVNEELKAYSLAIIQGIKELVQLNPLHKEELNLFMTRSSLAEPGRLADFSAAMTTAEGRELQEVLATFSIRARIKKVLHLLKKEADIWRIKDKISKQIDQKVNKQQRDYFLHEQLKAIKKELGLSKEGKEAELERFEERIKKLKLTPEAEERIKEEMEKLKLIEQASPEFNVSRTYLDWLTILPWGIFSKDSYDIAKASRILDKDHYSLNDVKDRILEFLAVGMLKGNVSGSILCFVGPPGVGKTSIGQSIARSIGRNFYRFSVGGIKDEAEIKGHRRTYIGALPGKFLQAIKVCKTANPVIMLDEIDKIGASYQGDPASALLEVLDPEQNREFLDHYLDVRFDLSNVFFICTANQLDTIPRPLLDRMEVIKLAGYIMQEKMAIAKKFIIPKQLKEHGVSKKQFSMTDRALKGMIEGYSREAGVRSLENNIKKLIRKCVKRIVEKKTRAVNVDVSDLEKMLGKPIFTDENYFKKSMSGVVMGLAWTSMGGDTLFIEATKVETGKAGFKQTGQLGNVMVESSEIAYTYIRSFVDSDHKLRDFFRRNSIHLHVPAGATPKDGPSAGVTMATALYSLAIGKPVQKKIAMTGELSLTGVVMPIGGVKEKTIAAKRAKVTNLIFPAGNKKDYDELPDHIKKGIKPYFVKVFSDIIPICFKTHAWQSVKKPYSR